MERIVLPKTYYIVPHTHWDREWYEPFQVFRARLVDLIDELLPMLENDEGFTHFTLDGQMAAVDDYLEIRPERGQRIAALVGDGRLVVGPWQILMDEFLVSGENTIRNLAKGLARAAQFGSAMRVGYLPDMFGHISQIPQILAKAGIPDAVVWRGVPAAIDRAVFKWTAPDGSSVRTVFLATSYSNGAALPEDPDALDARLKLAAAELERFSPGESILVMNGTDHIRPQPALPKAIEALNARANGDVCKISTLPEYIATLPTAGLPEQRGEMRSGAQSNLLMGVVSNRVDLRRLTAKAEGALERYAEPLAALYAAGPPGNMLTLAWEHLINNAAHDSICACSVDETVEAVIVRCEEALRLAEAVKDRAMVALAKRAEAAPLPGTAAAPPTTPTPSAAAPPPTATPTATTLAPGGPPAAPSAEGMVAFNPSPVTRAELVDVSLGVPEAWASVEAEAPDGRRLPTQELERSEATLVDLMLKGSQLLLMVPELKGNEAMGYWINSIEIDTASETAEIRLNVDTQPSGMIDADKEKQRVIDVAEADPDRMFHVTAVRPAVRRLLVKTPEIPPLGWAAIRLAEAAPHAGSPGIPDADAAGRVQAGERSIESRDLRLEVNDDGTVNVVHGASGLAYERCGRLVDGGEWGDTYNYAPPRSDALVENPAEVAIEPGRQGPLSASIKVRRSYDWPVSCTPDGAGRAPETCRATVDQEYELRVGEPFVRVRTRFTNEARDHRLRLHLPLPFTPSGSDAGSPFDVVHRGLEPEGGPHEVPLPTFPARGFVDVSGPKGGLAVLFEPVVEYEVAGDELALTLLRSTGMLSRSDNALRPMPAGPAVPSPLAQCLGPHEWEFALFPHAGDWSASEALLHAERFTCPLAVRASATPLATTLHDTLKLATGGVTLSACYLKNRKLVLRFWAGRDGGHVNLGHPAREASILGVPRGGPADAEAAERSDPDPPQRQFEFGPFEIKTLRLV